jgi:hypothetical protein
MEQLHKLEISLLPAAEPVALLVHLAPVNPVVQAAELTVKAPLLVVPVLQVSETLAVLAALVPAVQVAVLAELATARPELVA